MHITASLISQYLHCPREWRLFFHNLKTEHTSQTVAIGKYYHESRHEDKPHTEIEFDGIKIDQIQWDTVIEYKKAKTHPESARYQLLFYLYKLKQKGIIKTGKIIFKENTWSILVELDEQSESDLLCKIEEMKTVFAQENPPAILLNSQGKPDKTCKGCSYFDFCHL
jgi:CRISPR-associated exonuclease Cas4